MPTLFIIAVVIATAALLLIARKEQTHRNFAYGVAFAVPVLAILVYSLFLNPGNKPAPIPADENLRKEAFLDSMQSAEEKIADNLKADPSNPLITLDLASILMQQAEYDKAIAVLEEGLKKNPGNVDLTEQRVIAFFSKGLLLAEQQNFPAALESLKTARANAAKDAPYAKDLDMFIEIVENNINPKKPQPQKAPPQ